MLLCTCSRCPRYADDIRKKWAALSRILARFRSTRWRRVSGSMALPQCRRRNVQSNSFHVGPDACAFLSRHVLYDLVEYRGQDMFF